MGVDVGSLAGTHFFASDMTIWFSLIDFLVFVFLSSLADNYLEKRE